MTTRLVVSGAAGLVLVAMAVGSAGDESIEVNLDAPEGEGGAAAAPSAGAKLDALFAGMENGCRLSPGGQAFLDSFGTLGETRWSPGAAVKAPAGLASAFGAPRIAEETGEYARLAVDVQGATWQGYPVVRVVRTVGKFNGINGFALELEGSPMDVIPAVEGKLTITASCVESDPDCIAPAKMTMDASNDGGTRVACDWSM